MRKGFVLLMAISMTKFLSFACGWDWDTLQMEKRDFPTVHELIVGKFLRHSNSFYKWRIADRVQKLKTYPDSLALYNDLAWAHDKLGDHQRAIQLMLIKDSLKSGIYETHANLGTSYIHAGQLEKGLTHIKKAIEINPEAHFGREVYQQYVVEYVLERRDSASKTISFPLSIGTQPDFYTFLKERHFKDAIAAGSNKNTEIAKAIKGISGMMKFGNYDSPVLLECLGDLLYAHKHGQLRGAGHLASRAYMKAGLAMPNDSLKAIYFDKAKQSVEKKYADRGSIVEENYPVISMKKLEQTLKLEILAANSWFDDIKLNEQNWIESGVNVDSMFALTYYEEPEQKTYYNEHAGVISGDLSEEEWLNYQLKNPINVASIFSIPNISESDKALLDELYQEEFKKEEIDSSTRHQANDDSQKKSDEKGGFNIMLLALVGGGIIILAFILFKLRKSKS